MNKIKNSRVEWQSRLALVFMVALVYIISVALNTQAVPSGAGISYVSNDTAAANTPANRSDEGGFIHTINLNSTQQNSGWKAYVGNVTGVLTLDDSSQNTIYNWPVSTIVGEVYATRDSTITWGGVICAVSSTIATEQTFVGGLNTDDDSINNTYNYTQHATMQVGINTILNSTCRTTYTFVNDTFSSAPDESTNFTAILLEDTSNSLIYATVIENNQAGFNVNSNFDFQIIVPDNETATTIPYYFYLEIG